MKTWGTKIASSNTKFKMRTISDGVFGEYVMFENTALNDFAGVLWPSAIIFGSVAIVVATTVLILISRYRVRKEKQ